MCRVFKPTITTPCVSHKPGVCTNQEQTRKFSLSPSSERVSGVTETLIKAFHGQNIDTLSNYRLLEES